MDEVEDGDGDQEDEFLSEQQEVLKLALKRTLVSPFIFFSLSIYQMKNTFSFKIFRLPAETCRRQMRR